MKSGIRAGLGETKRWSLHFSLSLSSWFNFDYFVVVALFDLFQGFDIDFSKLRHKFDTGAVDLNDDNLVLDPDDTNLALLTRLTHLAITHHKNETVSY